MQMNVNFDIPVYDKIEAPMQASKWLKLPVLLDSHEMEALFKYLGEFFIVQTSGIMPLGKELISKEEFLDCYFKYVMSLKNGEIPKDPRINTYFTAVFSISPHALYKVRIDSARQMVQVKLPILQLQNHRFICGTDKKFHSMIFGPQSISWGIQFSYPQLYQNKEMQALKVGEGADFPNTQLFKALQRWIRENTRPTPFIIDNDRLVNVPIRLGKSCFEWINDHCQLATANLKVRV